MTCSYVIIAECTSQSKASTCVKRSEENRGELEAPSERWRSYVAFFFPSLSFPPRPPHFPPPRVRMATISLPTRLKAIALRATRPSWTTPRSLRPPHHSLGCAAWPVVRARAGSLRRSPLAAVLVASTNTSYCHSSTAASTSQFLNPKNR